MQQYILILLGILVILLIGVVYFGWRKLINLETDNNRNKYDIEALRGLLSKILEGDDPEIPPKFFQGQQMKNAQTFEELQSQYQPQMPQYKMENMNNFMNQANFKEEDKNDNDTLESDVETLESSEDEIPDDDESSVSIESLGDDSTESEEDEDESEEEESEKETESEEDETESEEEETESEEEEESSDSYISEDEIEKLIENELNEEKTTVKTEEEVKVVEEVKVDEEVKVNEEVREEKEEDNDDIKEVNLNDSKKGGKKLPNEPAKNYKVGFRIKSTNDGNTYEVIMSGKTKRWKLV